MKLLSLWEPWATLMSIAAKKIETRSWATSYRGWLAIHASKGGLGRIELAHPLVAEALEGVALSPGCIVAVASLTDCLPTVATASLPGVFDDYPQLETWQELAFGDYHEGRYAWVTVASSLFRLPRPIPFRAAQGLIEVPADTLTQIREQWKERAA